MDEGRFMELLQRREQGETDVLDDHIDELVETQYLDPVEEDGEIVGYEPDFRADTVLEWADDDVYDDGLLYER